MNLDMCKIEFNHWFSFKGIARCLNLNSIQPVWNKRLKLWISVETDMFRADFEMVKGRIRRYEWKGKCRGMFPIHLFCYQISMFSNKCWRSKGSNYQVQSNSMARFRDFKTEFIVIPALTRRLTSAVNLSAPRADSDETNARDVSMRWSTMGR